MGEFVRIAKVDDIPDPGKRIFEVQDRFIVIFHVNDRFWALDDLCTHDGGPLGEGVLDGYEIACPRHGAKFDIRDGRAFDIAGDPPDRCPFSKSREWGRPGQNQ